MATKAIEDLKGSYDKETKTYTGLAKLEHEVAMARQKVYAVGERGGSKDERKEAKEQLDKIVQQYNDYVNNKLNPQIRAKNDLVAARKQAKEEKRADEAERTFVEAKVAKDLKLAEDRYKGALAEAADMKEQEREAGEQQLLEQKVYAANYARWRELEVELEDSTKNLKKAQDNYAKALKNASDAANAVEVIANNGIWNPNGVQVGGRIRKRSGASANNQDNAGFTDFARPEGWEQRWAQAHPEEAAAMGIQAGLSKKEQREYNELAAKAAGGQEMTNAQRQRLHELAQKDPEQRKLMAEKEAENAKEKLTDAQQTLENVKFIKNILEQKLGLK